MSGVTDKHVDAARALLMKLHGATELGQRTEWLAQALADAEREERKRIVQALNSEADVTPCSEDAMVTRSNARLILADFSYEEADRLSEAGEA